MEQGIRTFVSGNESQLCRRISQAKFSNLGQEELAYCVADLAFSDGVYFKKIVVKELSGTLSSRLIPLGDGAGTVTNRASFIDWDIKDSELPPFSRISSNVLKLQFDSAEPFDLASSDAPPLLKQLNVLGPRNDWWTLPYRSFNLVFSTISVVERLLAPTQQIARLMFSPFRKAAYGTFRFEADLHVKFLVEAPFSITITGGRKRLDRALSSETLCLGYWLLTPENEEKLNLFSNSFQSEDVLLLPRPSEPIETVLQGIRVGRTIYVQNFGNHGASRWPVAWRNLYFSFAGSRSGLIQTSQLEISLANKAPFVRRRIAASALPWST